LNEPIEGNGVYWSSAGGRGYPIPVRVLSFESLYSTRDASYTASPAKTFAQEMLKEFTHSTGVPSADVELEATERSRATTDLGEGTADEPEAVDLLGKYISDAINTLRNDSKTLTQLRTQGVPWRGVITVLEGALPSVIDPTERNKMANAMVVAALNEILGADKWQTERRPKKSGPGMTTYVCLKNTRG
jgi:uncharacterized protein